MMKYTHYLLKASTPCCFHTNILLMILPNRQRNKKNSYGIDEVSMVSMLSWAGAGPLPGSCVRSWWQCGGPWQGAADCLAVELGPGRKHISLSPQQPDCWSWRVETVGRHGHRHRHHRQEGSKHETGMFGPWSRAQHLGHHRIAGCRLMCRCPVCGDQPPSALLHHTKTAAPTPESAQPSPAQPSPAQPDTPRPGRRKTPSCSRVLKSGIPGHLLRAQTF